MSGVGFRYLVSVFCTRAAYAGGAAARDCAGVTAVVAADAEGATVIWSATGTAGGAVAGSAQLGVGFSAQPAKAAALESPAPSSVRRVRDTTR